MTDITDHVLAIRRIRDAWRCCQTSASRRIAAINAAPPEAGLGRVERAWGGSGWWRVVEGTP